MARVPDHARGRARLILCAAASLPDCAAAGGGTPIYSGAWERHAVEADIPAGADRVVFGLRLDGAGAAWIDNVAMEEVAPAPAAR